MHMLEYTQMSSGCRPTCVRACVRSACTEEEEEGEEEEEEEGRRCMHAEAL